MNGDLKYFIESALIAFMYFTLPLGILFIFNDMALNKLIGWYLVCLFLGLMTVAASTEEKKKK